MFALYTTVHLFVQTQKFCLQHWSVSGSLSRRDLNTQFTSTCTRKPANNSTCGNNHARSVVRKVTLQTVRYACKFEICLISFPMNITVHTCLFIMKHRCLFFTAAIQNSSMYTELGKCSFSKTLVIGQLIKYSQRRTAFVSQIPYNVSFLTTANIVDFIIEANKLTNLIL